MADTFGKAYDAFLSGLPETSDSSRPSELSAKTLFAYRPDQPLFTDNQSSDYTKSYLTQLEDTSKPPPPQSQSSSRFDFAQRLPNATSATNQNGAAGLTQQPPAQTQPAAQRYDGGWQDQAGFRGDQVMYARDQQESQAFADAGSEVERIFREGGLEGMQQHLQQQQQLQQPQQQQQQQLQQRGLGTQGSDSVWDPLPQMQALSLQQGGGGGQQGLRSSPRGDGKGGQSGGLDMRGGMALPPDGSWRGLDDANFSAMQQGGSMSNQMGLMANAMRPRSQQELAQLAQAQQQQVMRGGSPDPLIDLQMQALWQQQAAAGQGMGANGAPLWPPGLAQLGNGELGRRLLQQQAAQAQAQQLDWSGGAKDPAFLNGMPQQYMPQGFDSNGQYDPSFSGGPGGQMRLAQDMNGMQGRSFQGGGGGNPQWQSQQALQQLLLQQQMQQQVLQQASRAQQQQQQQQGGQGGQGSQGVCRFFLQGYCSRGDGCFYSHINPATGERVPTRGSRGPERSQMKGSGQRSRLDVQQQWQAQTQALQQAQQQWQAAQLQHAAALQQQQLLPQQQQSEQWQQPAPPSQQSVSPPLGSSNDPTAALKKHGIDVLKLTSIEQVKGSIHLLSRDQLGCRFLQRKLEEQNSEAVDIVFNEVFDHIVELMTDPFGNYLCQKLLEHCRDEQRMLIVKQVAPHLVEISLNMHGTRAAQKLVEFVSTPQQMEICVQALRPGVVALIKDLNGNHVVQRCLHRLPPQDNQFIYNAVAQHCVAIATHRHGCCVFQRCIDYASEEQKNQLVNEVVSKALTLVQDPFGNYVVQYVLEQVPRSKRQIVSVIATNVVELSKQKFSSNVVEKCLQVSEADLQARMVQQLATPDHILSLLQDPFANYVVQRALAVAVTPHLEALVDVIRPHLPSLKNTSYGRRIQNRILKKTMSMRNGGVMLGGVPPPMSAASLLPDAGRGMGLGMPPQPDLDDELYGNMALAQLGLGSNNPGELQALGAGIPGRSSANSSGPQGAGAGRGGMGMPGGMGAGMLSPGMVMAPPGMNMGLDAGRGRARPTGLEAMQQQQLLQQQHMQMQMQMQHQMQMQQQMQMAQQQQQQQQQAQQAQQSPQQQAQQSPQQQHQMQQMQQQQQQQLPPQQQQGTPRVNGTPRSGTATPRSTPSPTLQPANGKQPAPGAAAGRS